MHNQKQLWCILLRVADEKKVANTSTFTELKRKHQNEAQEVCRSREFQPLNRNDTLCYRRNNNWYELEFSTKTKCVDCTHC